MNARSLHVLEGGARERGHAEVLGDREVREDAAALGHEAQAAARERVGPAASRPRRRTAPHPRSARSAPIATFNVVDFPAPFGPSSACTLARVQREVDAEQHVDHPVARRRRRGARASGSSATGTASAVSRSCTAATSAETTSARVARSASASASTGAPSPTSAPGTGAEVRGAHRGIGLHLGGRADRDDAAEVEHVDARAGAHHEPHVVLDEEHREAVVGQGAQQRAQLGSSHPR